MRLRERRAGSSDWLALAMYGGFGAIDKGRPETTHAEIVRERDRQREREKR